MPEDRDQLFEKALARELRAGAVNAASTCCDPETLAAYHERLLSAEEMAAAKEHLVSCARCQEILAHLELTQYLADAKNHQGVPVATLRAAAAAKSAAEMAPAAKKVVQLQLRKIPALRWAAPLGAIAAVLLVWVGARDLHKQAPKESVTQIAGNRTAQALREPAQPATPPGEGRQNAADDFSDLKEQTEASRDLHETESQNTPAKQPSTSRTRVDSLRPGSGFGAGTGTAPFAKSKQKEEALAAPKFDTANSSSKGLVSGAAGGVMAKTTPVMPAPAPPSVAERKADKDHGKLAYPETEPDAAAGANAAAAYALPPPPPALPHSSAKLRGTVTDPSGAVITGAHVALKSENGDAIAFTSTDQRGAYFFSDLAMGTYQLELQSPGFKTDAIIGLNIAGGETVMNAQLQIGALTETVEVAAQTVQLQTTAASTASVQTAEVSSLRVTSGKETRLKRLDSAALMDSTTLPFAVAAPDGKSQWRFGDLGVVFHSSDKGASWHSQISGVTAKLTGGSATSDKVCWIAGANSTLLRTTDGGKRWRRVIVPITGDLGGVQATGAKRATIWDVLSQLRYETSDGGSTWQQISNR